MRNDDKDTLEIHNVQTNIVFSISLFFLREHVRTNFRHFEISRAS